MGYRGDCFLALVPLAMWREGGAMPCHTHIACMMRERGKKEREEASSEKETVLSFGAGWLGLMCESIGMEHVFVFGLHCTSNSSRLVVPPPSLA